MHSTASYISYVSHLCVYKHCVFVVKSVFKAHAAPYMTMWKVHRALKKLKDPVQEVRILLDNRDWTLGTSPNKTIGRRLTGKAVS